MSDLVFNPEYRFSHAGVISSRIESVYYIHDVTLDVDVKLRNDVQPFLHAIGFLIK